MSLASSILDKQQQQKNKQRSTTFAPLIGIKKKPNSSNNSTPSTNSDNNNNATITSSSSDLLLSPPTNNNLPPSSSQDPGIDTSFSFLDPNPNELVQDTNVTNPPTITEQQPTSSTTITNNNNNNDSLDKTATTETTSKKQQKKKAKKTENKRKRNNNLDDEYRPESDNESVTSRQSYKDFEGDNISNSSLPTTRVTRSSTTKRTKKPTNNNNTPSGQFRTLSDYIKDAILNDYSTNTQPLVTSITESGINDRHTEVNNNNLISRDEFIDEEENFETDDYRENIHEIELEDSYHHNTRNNNNREEDGVSTNGSSFTQPSSAAIEEAKKARDNNEGDEFDDEFDLGDDLGTTSQVNPFTFDEEGNIAAVAQPEEDDEIPTINDHRQEYDYARIMRLQNLDKNKPITQATYARKGRGEKWTKDDVEMFYHGLKQFGTDFSMISRLFPKRTRREIQNKYKSEEKKNKKKIESALRNRAPIDMTLFQNKSKEKDKVQGVVRRKKVTSEEGTETEQTEKTTKEDDEWREISSTHSKVSQRDEFENEYGDLDDFEPATDIGKDKEGNRVMLSLGNNNDDDFEEVSHKDNNDDHNHQDEHEEQNDYQNNDTFGRALGKDFDDEFF